MSIIAGEPQLAHLPLLLMLARLPLLSCSLLPCLFFLASRSAWLQEHRGRSKNGAEAGTTMAGGPDLSETTMMVDRNEAS